MSFIMIYVSGVVLLSVMLLYFFLAGKLQRKIDWLDCFIGVFYWPICLLVIIIMGLFFYSGDE